jgi:hypothetical protein
VPFRRNLWSETLYREDWKQGAAGRYGYGRFKKGRKGMKTTALPAVAVEGRVISDRNETGSSVSRLEG